MVDEMVVEPALLEVVFRRANCTLHGLYYRLSSDKSRLSLYLCSLDDPKPNVSLPAPKRLRGESPTVMVGAVEVWKRSFRGQEKEQISPTEPNPALSNLVPITTHNRGKKSRGHAWQ